MKIFNYISTLFNCGRTNAVLAFVIVLWLILLICSHLIGCNPKVQPKSEPMEKPKYTITYYAYGVTGSDNRTTKRATIEYSFDIKNTKIIKLRNHPLPWTKSGTTSNPCDLLLLSANTYSRRLVTIKLKINGDEYEDTSRLRQATKWEGRVDGQSCDKMGP